MTGEIWYHIVGNYIGTTGSDYQNYGNLNTLGRNYLFRRTHIQMIIK